MTQGYVYVAVSAAGPVKVGVSVNPKMRCWHLKKYGFGKATLHWVSRHHPWAYSIEAHVKRRFRPLLVRGDEWFAADPDAVMRCAKNEIRRQAPKVREMKKWWAENP